MVMKEDKETVELRRQYRRQTSGRKEGRKEKGTGEVRTLTCVRC